MHWLLRNLKMLFHNTNYHANMKYRITCSVFNQTPSTLGQTPYTCKTALGNDAGEKTVIIIVRRTVECQGYGHEDLLSSSLIQQPQPEARAMSQHDYEVFAYHRMIETYHWDQLSRPESGWLRSTLPQGCELQAWDSQGLTPKHKFSRLPGFQKADTCLHQHFSTDTDECSETLKTTASLTLSLRKRCSVFRNACSHGLKAKLWGQETDRKLSRFHLLMKGITEARYGTSLRIK